MKSFTVSHNVTHLWQGTQRKEGERVTQALLGANLTQVREGEDGWVYVEAADTYRGWTECRFLTEQSMATTAQIWAPFADLRTGPDTAAPLIARLSLGSALSAGSEESNGWCAVTLPGGESGWVKTETLKPLSRNSVEWACELLGTPYLWGGSSAFGLDCSGLVQLCNKLAGLPLRRDADIQRSDPRFAPVAFEDLQAGDLVFFGKKDPLKITHVGMQLDAGHFIHSAGGAGVIITEWDGDTRYAPTYIDARRILPERAADPIVRVEAEDR